jgi:hypothetical protein
MARSLAINYYGHLCERRRGGRAEHRIEDVELNRINLITQLDENCFGDSSRSLLDPDGD